MALTALSACVDALVAWELGASAGAFPKDEGHSLLELGTRGIRCVGEGLPGALDGSKNALARELLCVGSVCAGQLSVITPAPPTQVLSSWVWSARRIVQGQLRLSLGAGVFDDIGNKPSHIFGQVV